MTRLAAVGGLLLGGTMVTHAVASEPGTPDAVPFSTASPADAHTSGPGADVVRRLGTSRTAGSWVGEDGRTVVAVTDEEAAAEVRATGAEPRMVRHSMDDFDSATRTLSSAPRVPGTAWMKDYRSNQVVVRGDSTVSEDDWSSLTEVADGIGDFVTMERVGGTFTTRLAGGLPVLSTAGRCSAGFNVTDGRREFILTAGHCGPQGSVWFSDDGGRKKVGTTVGGSFPGDDYSLIAYEGGKAGENAGVVAVGGGKGVRITGVADPTVGQRIFRSGSTSGLRDGEVTALDVTVNYPEGTVGGLIESDVCAEPGDSGGPMFSEGVALGVTSGGSGDCRSGGITYFQPLTKALADLDLKLIVAPGADGGSPSPEPSQAQGVAAPDAATPGSSTSVRGILPDPSTLVSRLADPRNVGPGLLVMGGSLVALVASRWIRAEQDRKAYRRQYSEMWG
ncbi:protease [Streptomyces variabilis]|uniref:Protease n=1 Tax=Streptomyces variabilis TaxID=67372 RepID=A0ABQ2TXF8_9ACTN|nr:protease [Streptomyces griseoincarnatus]GGT49165.1 protease [Streptomyces variabilis]